MPQRFRFRLATPEAAGDVAALYRRLGGELAGAPVSAGDFERLIQTGHAFLVAEREGPAGAVRFWEDDGIGWLDLLVACVPGAAPALIRAVEQWAQDHGLRILRMRVPADGRLPAFFARRGYLPVSRSRGPWASREQALLTLEKRLPLLTVREQRREDAAAIGALTGSDPWVLEQGARPGVFVAADGDRVVGTIAVRDGGGGVARMDEPALLDDYRERGLEAWMIGRATIYAETHGYHTAVLPAATPLRALRRQLEDAFWELTGDEFVRRFRSPVREDET